MNQVPFTAFLKIVPDTGDGRKFEKVRSREKMAKKVQQDLLTSFSSGNVALPGGGISAVEEDTNNIAFNSQGGVAQKPQFGDYPDTLTITGFYNGSTKPPYPSITFAHAGQYVTGPATGAPGWRSTLQPAATADAGVKALVAALKSAITSVDFTVLRIVYDGIVYGEGGYHLPK